MARSNSDHGQNERLFFIGLLHVFRDIIHDFLIGMLRFALFSVTNPFPFFLLGILAGCWLPRYILR